MIYLILADFVLFVHLAFVLYSVLGGFLAVRWRRSILLHLPAFLWAALVEINGWICPLTPIENRLRVWGGGSEYRADFVANYLLATLYPEGLTRQVQIGLGLVVLILNGIVYGGMIWRILGRRGLQR